ncbi:MAG: helix-turn-helix domain-containing protein [Parcubacteria group bacterium]
MKPVSLKENAINYRKKGYSYGMISEIFGLSKSTLSNWLTDIPYRPSKEVIARIGAGRLKSAQIKHDQKINNILEVKNFAKKELGKLSKRDLWLLGIGLYLGEGTKSCENIRVINSDPEIIKIAIRWFKKICGLNNKNLTVAIHLYPDSNIKKTLKFWAKITGVPIKQFGKTYIDKRINKSSKNKKKLPLGTALLTIKSNGEKEFGVILHRRIMGWIDGVLEQINAGVV